MNVIDRFRAVVEAMRVKVDSDLLDTINTYNKIPEPEDDDPWMNEGEVPYFMPGHPVEITNRLKDKDDDKVYKWKKYPLIVLLLDIDENNVGGIVNLTANVIIMNYSDENYNVEQRMENVFKPILDPLYELFFEELLNSGLFVWQRPGIKPDHRKINRPAWGQTSEGGNTALIFEDPLDAIVITDLRISVYVGENLCVKRLE